MIKIIAASPYLIIPIVFFSVDLFTFSFFSLPLLQTTALFSLVFLVTGPFPILAPWFFFLLGLFSNLCTSHFFPYPLCIAGILLLIKGASLYTNHLPLLFIGATVVMSCASQYVLGVPFTPSCTIFCLTGNLITVYISLKWFAAVKRGNRS